MHIVLLGDSILDNKSYTNGGPDVCAHLKAALPAGSRVTLLAVDGAVCDDVDAQLEDLPEDATHLLLSAGGNDALSVSNVLHQPASLIGEAMLEMSRIGEAFEARYADLLQVLAERNMPLAVCTIYNPHFSDEVTQRVIRAALCHFNDAIIRVARSVGTPILDLRAVCRSPEDFVSNIEPSDAGGAKIARAAAQMFASHDFGKWRSALYP